VYGIYFVGYYNDCTYPPYFNQSIAWRTRNIVSELCHNLAITVWISANSFWMCTEFFGVDHISIGHGFTVKHLAMIPFLIGMLILAYYYIWYKPRHKGIL
jgi:hypothetical protein